MMLVLDSESFGDGREQVFFVDLRVALDDLFVISFGDLTKFGYRLMFQLVVSVFHSMAPLSLEASARYAQRSISVEQLRRRLKLNQRARGCFQKSARGALSCDRGRRPLTAPESPARLPPTSPK